MTEKPDSNAIRQALDQSAARLDPPTLARLRQARERALARHDARQRAPAFAWAGATRSGWHGNSMHESYSYLAAAVLLAAFLIGIANLWQRTLEHDDGEVDIAIMTDEMPIDVYID